MDSKISRKGYRFRSNLPRYCIEEIENATKEMIYLTPPSKKNDLFEVRPVLTFPKEDSEATQASLIRITQGLIDIMKIPNGKQDPVLVQVMEYLGRNGDILLRPSRYEKQIVDRAVRELLDQFVSASFCHSWQSPLMWGYYANGGFGWCLEYLVYDQLFFHPTFPMNVTYTDHRPEMTSSEVLEVSTVFDLAKEKEIVGFIVAQIFRDYVQKLYLTKQSIWKHEEEFRIVEKGPEGNYDCPDLKLNGIIFGINTDKDMITSICSKFKGQLTFSQLEYQTDGYALQRRNLGN